MIRSTLLTIASLFLSLAAQAGTITLNDKVCTATRMCYGVPNNAIPAKDIFLNANAGYGNFNVTVDGVNYHGVGDVSSDFTLPACNTGGICITVSTQWKHWTTQDRSGHNLLVQHWELLGGTITTP